MTFRMGRGAAALGITAATLAISASFLTVAPLPAARAQEVPVRSENSAFTGIVVQGTGEVQVTPDLVRLTLGVENQGREASGVAQENARKTDALIKAVKAAGVADKDVRTANFSLNPQYDYNNQKAGQAPTIVGYQASNTVLVTIRKIADAGKVIDAAVQAGGNAANGVAFDLNDDTRDTAENAALQKAILDATRKAQVIAKAAGVSNIALVAVQEGVAAPPPIRPLFRMSAMAAGAPAPSTPVEAGQQTVTASVTVRFAFTPVSLSGK